MAITQLPPQRRVDYRQLPGGGYQLFTPQDENQNPGLLGSMSAQLAGGLLDLPTIGSEEMNRRYPNLRIPFLPLPDYSGTGPMPWGMRTVGNTDWSMDDPNAGKPTITGILNEQAKAFIPNYPQQPGGGGDGGGGGGGGGDGGDNKSALAGWRVTNEGVMGPEGQSWAPWKFIQTFGEPAKQMINAAISGPGFNNPYPHNSGVQWVR